MISLGAKVTDLKTYEVTGDLAPDATGTYRDGGEWLGKRYYQHVPPPWHIWWDGIDSWRISFLLGDPATTGWIRIDPNIEGVYDPYGDATGDATVTEA